MQEEGGKKHKKKHRNIHVPKESKKSKNKLGINKDMMEQDKQESKTEAKSQRIKDKELELQ